MHDDPNPAGTVARPTMAKVSFSIKPAVSVAGGWAEMSKAPFSAAMDLRK